MKTLRNLLGVALILFSVGCSKDDDSLAEPEKMKLENELHSEPAK